MPKLKIKKMNLFDAPPGSLLVHACNCKGVWGRGIAAEFKKRFPTAFKQYKDFCEGVTISSELRGKAFIFQENGYYIGCMFTSDDYGDNVDGPHTILEATKSAIKSIIQQHGRNHRIQGIYSNKFNSGLFNVNWSNSEFVLRQELALNRVDAWTVCDPDLDPNKEVEYDILSDREKDILGSMF